MSNNFSRLLGNEDTISRLTRAINDNALPHALLITGPRGSGKHTMAREIAAAMNCIGSGEKIPCGVCNRCKRIYSDSFPDIRLLSRSGGKATIGVEELRDFREDMFLSPTESPYKFYIVEDADLMTSAAQNALLKVLEEPPSSVHIILLATEGDKMLSTIKSRTQIISTEIFDYEKLKRHVSMLSDSARALVASDPYKLKGILLASGGIIGEALMMFDEGRILETESLRKTITDFAEALSKKTPFSLLYARVQALPQKRDELRHTLEEIRGAIRDMISVKLSDDIVPVFFLSREQAEEISEGIGKKRLTLIFDIITSAIEDIDKNVLIPPLLTDIAVKIREL